MRTDWEWMREKYPNCFKPESFTADISWQPDKSMPLRARKVEISCGPGWKPILSLLCDQLEPICAETGISITQIKQKWGQLRVYVSDFKNVEINRFINAASQFAGNTCETCGQPGKLRKGPWMEVLCDKHAEGREVIVLNFGMV